MHHPLDGEGLDARHHLIDEEIHVQDLAEAQGVDEAQRGEILEVDSAAEGGLAGEKVAGVDRPRRLAVDFVEGRGQTEPFQGDQHAPGDDAAHASALDDEPEFRVEAR